MDKKLKGYLLISFSAILAGLGTTSQKIIQQAMSPESGAFYWFMSSLIWSILILFIAKKQKEFITAIKNYWKKLILFGMLNSIGIILFWYSLRAIGASSTAFLSRTEVIFILLFGVFLLKERFNKLELVGMLMAIIGLFAFTYSPATVFNFAAIYVILRTISYSLGMVIAKKEIQKIDPFVFVFVRIFLPFIFLTIYFFSISQPRIPDTRSIAILATIPPLSGVFAFFLLYTAFKYIDLSKATIVAGLYPIAVWIFSWILFGESLTLLQIIGGALILIGVSVIMFFKNINKKVKKVG